MSYNLHWNNLIPIFPKKSLQVFEEDLFFGCGRRGQDYSLPPLARGWIYMAS